MPQTIEIPLWLLIFLTMTSLYGLGVFTALAFLRIYYGLRK